MAASDLLLVLHIAAGTVGLIASVPAIRARKRRGLHTRAGRVFAVCALVVGATAVGLTAARPGELLGLGVLGVLTMGWGGGGWWIARTRPALPGGWLTWHLQMMGSAVIGFVTAVATTTFDGHLLAWVVPIAVGSAVVGRTAARRRRPRPAAAAAQ